MATAVADERSYYLDDFADEVVPCDTTLEGWATWLSKPDAQWSRDAAANDGDRFRASILRWGEDVVARRVDGAWSLSREPEGDAALVAVRYGQGIGWDPENIIGGGVELDPATARGSPPSRRGRAAPPASRSVASPAGGCDDDDARRNASPRVCLRPEHRRAPASLRQGAICHPCRGRHRAAPLDQPRHPPPRRAAAPTPTSTSAAPAASGTSEV